MDLQGRFRQILNDSRLADELPEGGADDETLIAEYGADNKPEAIYLLATKFGWNALFTELVRILRDDNEATNWETVQIVLFYAATDHRPWRRRYRMPADSTIALLYHRFPGGADDGDRIWAIVCALKGVKHWSNYDPLRDPQVLSEMDILKRERLVP